MGMRLTCRERAPALKMEMWMRTDDAPIPMHVHPPQEEGVTVIRGTLRSRSGKSERLLGPGDEVVSPPGEAHTIAPANHEEVEVLAQLSPALSYGDFLARSFALARAGHG